ncbi:hypothetical protein Tco_1351518 [Tanacetum coccineum]
MYDRWKTRIILYIQGKENGEMLKDSINNDPYQFKSEITIKDTDGVTEIRHPQRLEDLEGQDKLRYDNDIKAVNILLLGLPVNIYTLINQYQTTKEIWDRVKELIEGTEMTKQERESMLYDEFDKFTSESEESFHSYYLRFDKLDVIVNGDLEEEPAPTGETSAPPAPKTAKQLAARRNQKRVKRILLLAIPDEYLLKFHNITLIMRNKLDIDEIDIDDLYNNLRVYEDELKRSSGSNSASQNLAFLSSKNNSGTNEVSTAIGDFGVSTASGINQVPYTPCAHDVAYSFFAQPTTSPQLENEDFQQIDGDDLEELDLRWQVAILTVRVKKFIQRTGRNLDFKEKRPVSHDKSKIECYNYHKKGHFAREWRSGRNQERRSYGDNGRSNAPTNESSSQVMVAQDGLGGYDWSNDFEVELVNYALMAISSSSSYSSSDSEVQKCSKQRLESFKTLQKNYDTEREKHNKARLRNSGYELALESLESRILRHEKNELDWGEKYEFQNYELKPSVTPAKPISTARPSVSTSKPISTARPSINTARPVSIASPNISIARPGYASRPIYPRMDNVRPRGSCLPIKRSYYTKPAFRPKDLKQDVKTFRVKIMTTTVKRAVVNTGKGKLNTDLKKSRWVWRPNGNYMDHVSKVSGSFMLKKENPEICLQDHAVVDSGCSSHMTGNKAYLLDYKDYNGGFVAFGSDPKGGQHLVLSGLVSAAQKHLTMVLMIGLGQRCSLDRI